MLDYDKLFAIGNVIGVKHDDKVSTGSVDSSTRHFWTCRYENDELRYKYDNDVYEIQWIVTLTSDGEIAERIFDRGRDMEEPMPKLENGMFVRTTDKADPFDDYGVVVGDKIVYRTGGWCDAKDEIPYIVAVWNSARCFDECGSSAYAPIWEKK